MSLPINSENTREFARQLDEEDPLKKFREKFYIPILHGKESIYFSGHSLGLQPRTAQDLVLNEMEDWANYGKEARMHGRKPWAEFHDQFPKRLAPILGALPHEVVAMNQLTTNLHLLLATFYQPTEKRFKILCEENPFSSDMYAMVSHLRMAGLSPEDALIQVRARKGEFCVRDEDILEEIARAGDSLALVCIGGVHYRTGQLFDMEVIAEAAHGVGALLGVDLAHAAGNVRLKLHDWKVDFAVWCGYKYLNSGPGGIGGAFIHDTHLEGRRNPAMAGWWGNKKETRFAMNPVFEPAHSAEAWQLSAPSILNLAVHEAALDIYFQANFKRVLDKSALLSGYLLQVLKEATASVSPDRAIIITPQEPHRHGSQLSVRIAHNATHLVGMLRKNSIIADLQGQDILRIAPVPLYNRFEEVYEFGQVFKHLISA